MVPKIYDGLLGSWTGVTGAQAGTEYNVENSSASGAPEQLAYEVAITAGTGTWILEGRNSPLDAFVQIDTGTASKTGTCGGFKKLRLRWSAATGLTAEGSVNNVLRP